MSKFGFDLTDYAGDVRDYSPLPKGEYVLSCVDAEVKATKSGGEMISATFEVLSGQHTGRKIWNNFNIHNKSEAAQRIGREQVASWARACGKPNANSFDDLIDRKFKASVDIEKGSNGYSDKNRIVGYVVSGTEPKAETKSIGIDDLTNDIPTDKDVKPSPKKKNPWD